MIHYLTPEAAEGFTDKDGDGKIDLRPANRVRFGGAPVIYPLGVVPEGSHKGMMAFVTVEGEGFPAEDTTPPSPPAPAPEPEPQPEPVTPPSKRVILGCNIGAGGMGKGTVYGTNYSYAPREEIDLAFAHEMRALRMPYRFYRMFDVKTGQIDPNISKLIDAIDYARSVGFEQILVSEHSFGNGPWLDDAGNMTDILVEHVPILVAKFDEVFGKYKGQDWFVPQFVNEPVYNADWYAVAMAFLRELRLLGWTNPIIIATDGWSGLHSFNDKDRDSCKEIAAAYSGKVLFDCHQYVDSDSSGTKPTEVMGKKGSEPLTREEADAWLARKLTPKVEMFRAAGLSMSLTEFGLPNTDAGAVGTEAFLDWLDANSDVIKVATWWVLSSWMLYSKSSSFYGLSAANKYAPSPHLLRIAALRK